MLSLILGLLTLGMVFSVPNGNIGIKTQFGKVVGKVDPGIHVKAPLGFASNTNIDTKVQSSHLDLVAGSKENTTVTFKTTVNWHIDPKNAESFYRQYGDDYKDNIETQLIKPSLNQAVKTAATDYAADEQLNKQPETRKKTVELIKGDMEKFYLVIDNVAFDDIDFDKAYNASFERKAVAKQDAETASFLKLKAQNESEAAIITASGAAKVKVIAAEATAKEQQLTRETLSPELLQKQAIEKWNGAYPQYMTGSNIPLIQIGK